MAAEGKNCTEIVRVLNGKHILIYGREWNDVTVLHILTNPKYTGAAVWNRHTQRLHSPLRLVDPRFWIIKLRAFPAIVDQKTYDRAQATIKKIRDSHWSAERVLERIRRVLKVKGKLSERLLRESRGTPSTGTIRKYFGTYKNLYETLNYTPAEDCHVYRIEQARRSAVVRQALGDELTTLFPDNVKLLRSWRGARSILRMNDTFMVSILFCRHERIPRRPTGRAGKARGRPFLAGPCWAATPPPTEREHITLICLLSKRFDRVLDFYVVNRMGDRAYIRLRRNGKFLRQAIKLDSLRDFYTVVTSLWELRNANPKIAA